MRWDASAPGMTQKTTNRIRWTEADLIGYVLGETDRRAAGHGGFTMVAGPTCSAASSNACRERRWRPSRAEAVRASRHHRFRNGRQTYPKNGKVGRRCRPLRIRPRDAAENRPTRCLNQGARAGRQIVFAGMDLSTRSRRASRPSTYFSGPVLLWPAMVCWAARSISGDSEVKWIAAMGSGGQRIFIVPDRDLVVMTTSGLYFQPRQGDGALDAYQFRHSIRPRQEIRRQNIEPEIHRRRPHHPPHHRAGNHLPAGPRHAAGPDAGTAGREPVDAKGRRARRQGHADPVLPVLCGEDAAPHHPDRQRIGNDKPRRCARNGT